MISNEESHGSFAPVSSAATKLRDVCGYRLWKNVDTSPRITRDSLRKSKSGSDHWFLFSKEMWEYNYWTLQVQHVVNLTGIFDTRKKNFQNTLCVAHFSERMLPRPVEPFFFTPSPHSATSGAPLLAVQKILDVSMHLAERLLIPFGITNRPPLRFITVPMWGTLLIGPNDVLDQMK